MTRGNEPGPKAAHATPKAPARCKGQGAAGRKRPALCPSPGGIASKGRCREIPLRCETARKERTGAPASQSRRAQLLKTASTRIRVLFPLLAPLGPAATNKGRHRKTLGARPRRSLCREEHGDPSPIWRFGIAARCPSSASPPWEGLSAPKGQTRARIVTTMASGSSVLRRLQRAPASHAQGPDAHAFFGNPTLCARMMVCSEPSFKSLGQSRPVNQRPNNGR